MLASAVYFIFPYPQLLGMRATRLHSWVLYLITATTLLVYLDDGMYEKRYRKVIQSAGLAVVSPIIIVLVIIVLVFGGVLFLIGHIPIPYRQK